MVLKESIVTSKIFTMPFKSEKQRRWMHANKPKMAKDWEKKKEAVEEKKERDYKDEYKKFQSSKKMKKYRAELNKYNRKKGTYGNGDGKDASHKGGKIVGFEAQSKNRGRAEKSRLKKESIVSEGKLETLALNLLRNINKEIGISKYDHTKTAHFNKVMKFLRSKMRNTPDKKLGDIAMSYDKYRQKQPKATIPDIDSVKDMEKTLKKLGMKESVNEQEMSIKDAFKDLVKDHGSKKALDILTSVLTGGIGFEDPKKKKKFQQKLLKKMTTEAKLNENPAAIAAAQRVVIQAKAGKKVSVNTARQSSYAKKDPSTHKKAKSMWQRIKDKFSKKEGVNEGDIESRELKLYIDNDSQLYNSRFMPIIKNLSKKMKKGNYDKKLAIKGFMYLVDAGAKKYVKDHGGNAKEMFSKKDRIAVASDLADEFEEIYKNKEYSFMESVNEKKLVGRPMVKKAIQIAKKMSGNMTGAVKKIEKMMPGLSKQIEVEDALKQANESINEEKYFDPNGELKKYMDKVFKKAGIRVIKYDPMKQNFYNGIWGGFYTVASSNIDSKGVKRSSAVLPVYIDKKSQIELGVSGDGFKLGKAGSSSVLKNLKDFKKSDLDEGTCGYSIDGKGGDKPAGPHLLKKKKKYDVNEAKDPDIIAQIRGVLKKGYSAVKDPVSKKKMKMDTYTASAITQVYDALNTTNKKKFSSLPLLKMQKLAFKFVK